MSEPTREEKLKTIKLARKLFENMAAEYTELMQEYGQVAKEMKEISPQDRARLALWMKESQNREEQK